MVGIDQKRIKDTRVSGLSACDELVLGFAELSDHLGRGNSPSLFTRRTALVVAHLADRLGVPPMVRADAFRAALLHRVAADTTATAVRTFGPSPDRESFSRKGTIVSSALAPFSELSGVAKALSLHEAHWDGSGLPAIARDQHPQTAQLVMAGRVAAAALELSEQSLAGHLVASDLIAASGGVELAPDLADQAAGVVADATLGPQLKAPAAALRHICESLRPLSCSERALLAALADCTEARNPYAGHHAVRTARLAKGIGKRLKLDPPVIDRIELGALAQNLGELILPDSFWRHRDLLPSERLLLESHPSVSSRFCEQVSFLRPVAGAVAAHHERLDGSGYPRHLKGQSIPLEARVISVADSLEAMRSERVFRDGLTSQQITSTLREKSGKWLDPTIVDAALIEIGSPT